MIASIEDRAAFQRLRRDGTRIRITPLWCTYVPDPDLTPTGVAFALGRAVGNAVTRNRLRRRLRAILAASDVPPGLLLIGANPPAVELTFDELGAKVSRLLAEVRRAAAT